MECGQPLLPVDNFEATVVHVSPLALASAEHDELRAREYRIATELDEDGVPL